MSCVTCGRPTCSGCNDNISCSQVISPAIPCGVRPCSPLSRCGSSSCNTCSSSVSNSLSGCGCGSSSCSVCFPSTVNPYYASTPQCQEDHCQEINNYFFTTNVKTDNAFGMPACSESVSFVSSDIVALQVGSYLWSKAYGYLEVTGFDAINHQITVVNHCNEGNAAVGSQILACSEFDVVDPPCTQGNTPGGAICVAIDFTAPAIGDCLLITLTDTTGLVVNDVIQIGSGRYSIGSINSSTVISICNDGDGLVAGTPVIAKNSSGEYQYCINVVGNCCTIIQERFGGILEPCSDFENLVLTQGARSAGAAGDLTAINSFVETPEVTLTFVNSSTCRSLGIQLNVFVSGVLDFSASAAVFLYPKFTVEIYEKIDAGAYTLVHTEQKAVLKNDLAFSDGFQTVFNTTQFNAPGVAMVFKYKGRVTRLDGSAITIAAASFIVDAQGLGVAV